MEIGCIKQYNACVKKRINIMRFQILKGQETYLIDECKIRAFLTK